MSSGKKITIISNILLLSAAIIWGGNFVFAKNAAAVIGPFTFMSIRYFIGATTILPFMLFIEKRKPLEDQTKYNKKSFAHLFRVSACMALVQLSSSVMGQWGLAFTTASKAAFLNATYVVLVPFLAFILFRSKATVNMWIGVFLATFGLYHLSFTGDSFSINPGDLMEIISASFGALHLLLISKFVREINGMHMICLEFYCASVYCFIASMIIENPSLSQIAECSTELLYASVLGSGICYMFQVIAQKYTDPTVAALLMSLESVFGALAGMLILGEMFTPKEILGSACVFTAVILAQLKPKKIVLKVTRKHDDD